MKRLILTPFLLVLIFGCSNQKNSIQQRRIDCADATAGVISYEDFFKKYKIGIFDNKRENYYDNTLLNKFCQFYKSK